MLTALVTLIRYMPLKCKILTHPILPPNSSYLSVAPQELPQADFFCPSPAPQALPQAADFFCPSFAPQAVPQAALTTLLSFHPAMFANAISVTSYKV
jgi:hypothetical protein